MGEQQPDQEQKRRRADAIIGDFISEREELREGPRFHVPPFVERTIAGTKTVFYMPAEAVEIEAPGRIMIPRASPAEKPAPRTDPGPAPPAQGQSPRANAAPRAPAQPAVPAAHIAPPAAPTAPQAVPVVAQPPVPEEPQAPDPAPGPAPGAAPPGRPPEPAKQAPFEFPERLMASYSGPASFRRPYMRPDTSARKAQMQAFTRRPTAKELIARLRVVKDGVQTSPATARAAATQAPAEPLPEPLGAEATEPGEEMAAPSQAAPAAARELEQKADGGKLCPSCGAPISDRNRMLMCTDCGKMNCDSCNRYELAHMKSDIYYEYQFDFPLCLQCYGKAFSIQRLLGRAGVCYGNGNYSYALYYANQALEMDPESRYAGRARDIIAKTNKAHEQSQERDKEWRLQRKQFAASRLRHEDPSWRH